jgi:hypothetical protein
MGFIIVWRNNYRDPHVDVDSRGFIQSFYTYEDAKNAAEGIISIENETTQSPWYFDYRIYEEK